MEHIINTAGIVASIMTYYSTIQPKYLFMALIVGMVLGGIELNKK